MITSQLLLLLSYIVTRRFSEKGKSLSFYDEHLEGGFGYDITAYKFLKVPNKMMKIRNKINRSMRK